jgi:hypothetical protein
MGLRRRRVCAREVERTTEQALAPVLGLLRTALECEELLVDRSPSKPYRRDEAAWAPGRQSAGRRPAAHRGGRP